MDLKILRDGLPPMKSWLGPCVKLFRNQDRLRDPFLNVANMKEKNALRILTGKLTENKLVGTPRPVYKYSQYEILFISG